MKQFIEMAKQYAEWVEDYNRLSSEDLYYVHDLLLSLYSSAFRLQYYPEAAELKESRIDYEEWQAVRKSFVHLPFDYYQEVFNPLDFSENSTVTASLADDLADIYRDLKPAIIAYDSGNVRDAEDDLKRNFEIHWSQHAISAIKAIRQFFANTCWRVQGDSIPV